MASADSDFFEGDIFDFDAAKPPSPEEELWLAVVARVWEDAFEASDVWLQNSDRTCSPDLVRAEARRWLVHDFGDFRRDREEICVRAGLDPDAIHKAAIRRNKLAKVEDTERRGAEIIAIDRTFARLAANENVWTRERVTRTLRELVEREARL